MNTPKLRWLIRVSGSTTKTYPVVTEHHHIVEMPIVKHSDPVLQQQVADDKGVLSWIDVPVVYEEKEKT